MGTAHHFGKSVEIAHRQGLIIGKLLGVGQQVAEALSADLAVRHQNKLVLRMKLEQRGATDRVLRQLSPALIGKNPRHKVLTQTWVV